jgi:hypothetical protein
VTAASPRGCRLRIPAPGSTFESGGESREIRFVLDVAGASDRCSYVAYLTTEAEVTQFCTVSEWNDWAASGREVRR